MIKNDIQLKRAQDKLDKVKTEIKEFELLPPGIGREILILPLLAEVKELENDINEYQDITSLPFEETIQRLRSNPMLIDHIGELLSKLRLAFGLTQEQLAEMLGWDQPNISRFESENYNSQTIGKVVEYASALGIYLHVSPSLSQRVPIIKILKDVAKEKQTVTDSTEIQTRKPLILFSLNVESENLPVRTSFGYLHEQPEITTEI